MNRRSASLLGVLFVAILAASIVMLTPPGTSSSGAKVLSYYASHRTISEVDGLLIALSVCSSTACFVTTCAAARQSGA